MLDDYIASWTLTRRMRSLNHWFKDGSFMPAACGAGFVRQPGFRIEAASVAQLCGTCERALRADNERSTRRA